MLSLAAPAWLLGWLLLPVIRWLHRGGQHRRAVQVLHLGLWRGALVQAAAGAEKHQPPDPAWRRRALWVALVFTALAGPQWPSRHPGLTLWVDNSVSMQTQEVNGTRLTLGLAQARRLLAQTPHGDLQVRFLTDPWQQRALPGDASQADRLTAPPAKPHLDEPGPPPAALLQHNRLHWLVTDGADPALLNWPGARRADRVVQVGQVVRNVGIESVSARRRVGQPDRLDQLDLLIKLNNGGTASEQRTLQVSTATQTLPAMGQQLPPGASVWVQTVLQAPSSAAAAQVVIALTPGDALTADDTLVLDLAPLQRWRVAVDGRCPAAWWAAVAAHPALQAVGADQAGAGAPHAALVCAAQPGPPAPWPTLQVRTVSAAQGVSGPAQWSSAVPESDRVHLPAAGLRAAGVVQPRGADTVLLALGPTPVVVARAGVVPLLETTLDFALATGPDSAAVPLLVNLLFERLLQRPLLHATVAVNRGAQASRVVLAAPAPAPPPGVAALGSAELSNNPGSGGTALAAQASPAAVAPVDGTRTVVIGALCVLLWELLAVLRQQARLRPPKPVGAAR